MSGAGVARARMLGDLIVASHLMTLEQLPGTVASYADRVGWPQVLICLADLQQTRLYVLSGNMGVDHWGDAPISVRQLSRGHHGPPCEQPAPQPQGLRAAPGP